MARDIKSQNNINRKRDDTIWKGENSSRPKFHNDGEKM